MNLITGTQIDFGDGKYYFWLPLPVLREFQDKHGSICAFEWHLRGAIGLDEAGNATFTGGGENSAHAIRDLVRLALIGGNHAIVDGQETNVSPTRAADLVDLYCYPSQTLGDTAALAWRIVAAAIYGNKIGAEEKVKEPQDA